jgi:hypothetical protein
VGYGVLVSWVNYILKKKTGRKFTIFAAIKGQKMDAELKRDTDKTL